MICFLFSHLMHSSEQHGAIQQRLSVRPWMMDYINNNITNQWIVHTDEELSESNLSVSLIINHVILCLEAKPKITSSRHGEYICATEHCKQFPAMSNHFDLVSSLKHRQNVIFLVLYLLQSEHFKGHVTSPGSSYHTVLIDDTPCLDGSHQML